MTHPIPVAKLLAPFVMTLTLGWAAPMAAQDASAPVVEGQAGDTQAVEPQTPDTTVPAQAAVLSADETTLDDWLWLKRPVVVFADSPLDPRYIEQMELISARLEALLLRDVVVITDTDPNAGSSVRKTLRPRGFMLTVMAKDGSIVIRKPAPWSVREISRSIDKLPQRQQEVRSARDAAS